MALTPWIPQTVASAAACAWVKEVVPTPRDNAALLSDVAALSASDVWAVGSHYDRRQMGHPLALHWDGTRWSVSHTPNDGPLGARVDGIAAVSPTDIWAVGVTRANEPDIMPRPFVMHWDGTSWSIVPTPLVEGGLTAVAASATDGVWAVGYRKSRVVVDGVKATTSRPLVMHWDSTRWQVVRFSDPHPGRRGYLTDVTTLDGKATVTGIEWRPGDVPGAPSRLAGYIRQRDRSRWEQAWIGEESPLHAASDVGWAVGYRGGHSSQILALRFDAGAWIEAPLPEGDAWPWVAIDALNVVTTDVAGNTAGDVWMAGYWRYESDSSAIPFIARWRDGRGWTPELIRWYQPSDRLIEAVDVDQSGTEVWAVGARYGTAVHPLVFHRTCS
jgi:hypothetical protein